MFLWKARSCPECLNRLLWNMFLSDVSLGSCCASCSAPSSAVLKLSCAWSALTSLDALYRRICSSPSADGTWSYVAYVGWKATWCNLLSKKDRPLACLKACPHVYEVTAINLCFLMLADIGSKAWNLKHIFQYGLGLDDLHLCVLKQKHQKHQKHQKLQIKVPHRKHSAKTLRPHRNWHSAAPAGGVHPDAAFGKRRPKHGTLQARYEKCEETIRNLKDCASTKQIQADGLWFYDYDGLSWSFQVQMDHRAMQHNTITKGYIICNICQSKCIL